jgi:phosphoserine phosphatase RsbU/P
VTASLSRCRLMCEAAHWSMQGRDTFRATSWNESGMAERTLESNGLPLGLFHDIRYSRNSASLLRAGEIVILWTDGVTESSGPSGSELGVARALKCVRQHREESASAIVDRVYRTAREFASAGVQSDDITSVILKVQQQ